MMHITLWNLICLQVQEEKTQEGAELKDREHWTAYDPNLIAEALFAAANIFSSLKLVNIFTVSFFRQGISSSLKEKEKEKKIEKKKKKSKSLKFRELV